MDFYLNILFNPDKDSLHENISYYHIKTDHFVSEEFTQISELVNQGIQDNVVYPLDFSYSNPTKNRG
jgi:hypothetical protein